EEHDRYESAAHEQQQERETPVEQRFEHMNVAAVFGGDVAEPEEQALQHQEDFHHEEKAQHQEDAPETAYEATSETQQSPGPWQASGQGVVEEEEIEEEESDLPGFEEEFELADYEELEEQEMGRDERMIAAGRELTEAVRDAHVNERATGQYEE